MYPRWAYEETKRILNCFSMIVKYYMKFNKYATLTNTGVSEGTS